MQRVLEVTAARFDVATPHGPLVVSVDPEVITVAQKGKKPRKITRPEGDHTMNIGRQRICKIVENHFRHVRAKS